MSWYQSVTLLVEQEHSPFEAREGKVRLLREDTLGSKLKNHYNNLLHCHRIPMQIYIGRLGKPLLNKGPLSVVELWACRLVGVQLVLESVKLSQGKTMDHLSVLWMVSTLEWQTLECQYLD